MKYKIIESSYLFDLEDKVNKHLEDGWEPQGGVALLPFGFSDRFVQALIKE